jgi:sulfate adenylyltransferase subunit 2
MREVVAQFQKPVMLYSIEPPFALLHVDTTWKFREMITFRDQRAAELGLDLIVHVSEEGVRAGIGPFT